MNKESSEPCGCNLYVFKSEQDAMNIVDGLRREFPNYTDEDYLLDKCRILIYNLEVHKDIKLIFKTL